MQHLKSIVPDWPDSHRPVFRHALPVLSLALFGALPAAAGAAVTLELSDGTNTVQCTDGGSCDSSGLAGLVNFSIAFPDWVVSTTLGITKPSQGSSLIPSLHISNFNVSALSPDGTLTVKLSETGFTTPAGLASFDFITGGTLAPGATTKVDAYLDNTDTLFGQGTHLGSTLGPYPSGSFSGSSLVSGVGDGSFSLTLIAQFTAPSAGFTSSNLSSQLDLHPVPVPAAVWLLGSALGVLGWRGRSPLSQGG